MTWRKIKRDAQASRQRALTWAEEYDRQERRRNIQAALLLVAAVVFIVVGAVI